MAVFLRDFLGEKCYHTFIEENNFFEPDCLKSVVAEILGIAITLGAFGLKIPQILKICSSKSVVGLSPATFYLEVVVYVCAGMYNFLLQNPISTYGEMIIILVQDIILVLLLWHYASKPPTVLARIGYVMLFLELIFFSYFLPEDKRSLLVSVQIPIVIMSKFPQIISNHNNRHTGQLSLITVALTTFGSVARIFTTIQLVGMDIGLLFNYALSVFLNGLILFQILIFWNRTNAYLLKQSNKKEM